MTIPRLTVIQHGPNVPLGRFAGWLDGVEVRLVRAWAGEPVPDREQVGDGLLVLGGTMSAHDDATVPWLPTTKELIADVVSAEVPMLGICLGHQLLAAATGGRVAVGAPAGRESGAVEVVWAAEAAEDPVLGPAVRAGGGGSARQPAMHSDAVTALPPGARPLGRSAAYPVQAMRLGTALGVQFHPEASPEQLGRWAQEEGLDAGAVVSQAREHDTQVAVVGRELARAFARQVREAAGA